MKNKIKILIAEHDPVDLELIDNELKNGGFLFESLVVHTEPEYLLALEDFCPDIILSDYTFPTFDGPLAFKLKQEISPATPFIFVSGTIGEERSIELIKSGVTDYCLKDKLITLNLKVLRALKESKANLQKQITEAELVQSEKRLARAQQLAHMGNWELNFASNDFSWSAETFRIHGLYPGQNKQSLEYALSFIHAEDRVMVQKKITDSQKNLADFSITYRIIQQTGVTRHLYLDGKLEFNSEGKATGLYGIVHDVTEIVLLETKLAAERSSRVKEMTDAVLTAQETERVAIGMELHDNLSQILGATKLYVELAKTDIENREAYLDKSAGFISDVIEQIRKISKTLITPPMHSLGLFDCIKILKNDLSIISPVKMIFLVEGIVEEDLEEKLQVNIYRIIQEQLNNIIKHSKATRATIRLSRIGDELVLLISDNGKGYDTTKIRKGVGIRNIMSRVEYFQGKTEITSKTGKGYKLKVELPIRKECA